jgi:hypothetical protein
MLQDNSGTIERDEFLSLPQVSSNPLATRYLLPILALPSPVIDLLLRPPFNFIINNILSLA